MPREQIDAWDEARALRELEIGRCGAAMTLETDRDRLIFQISRVLRTRCRGYLKIKGRVDDPVPGIVARDILEHLERCGYRVVREAPR